MSQLVVDAPEVRTVEASSGFRHSEAVEGEFSYRPVPMTAMVGGVLALVSVSALLVWLAIPVAVLAAIVCLVAAVQILRSNGEFAGKWLALGGLAFACINGVAGVLLTMHRYRTELPPGYERKSFARDISAHGVGMEETGGLARLVIPDAVKALEGKRVYLKGFMYPTDRQYEITSFILCKDNAQCCFGGEPALQDMIGVILPGSATTDHNPSLTGVAGTLRLNQHYQGGKLEPIYILDADSVMPALTSL